MRIAMITGEFPPMEGGVGDFTYRLSHALHAAGHEVHVLTSQGPTPVEAGSTEDDLHIDRIVATWGLRAPGIVRDWIRRVQPDVVNLQYQAAAFRLKAGIHLFVRSYARADHPPLVVTYHDLLPPYLFPKAGKLRQKSVWQLARVAAGVIVTNDSDYDGLTTALGHETPPIRLIPIGSNIPRVNSTPEDRKAWRVENNISPDALLVGFFGFLNHSKGIEALLQATAALVEQGVPIHLLFIGGRTGSSDATNAAYAREIDGMIDYLHLQERVHQTGFVTPETVSAALQAVDICALPFRDGASMRRGTLHAALAHGKAIITTTPSSPCPDLRDGRNVLFVPPEDPDALAKAIYHLWAHPALRADLERGAAATSHEFSWEGIAIRTARFFEVLTKGEQR